MSAHDTGRTNVKVWDLLVRVGHWALLIGIFAAWFTQGKWHEWLGYAVLGIVLVRIVWVFIGYVTAAVREFVGDIDIEYYNIMSDIIQGGLFFFETEGESLKFYNIFTQELTDSSAIYAAYYEPSGHCSDENT